MPRPRRRFGSSAPPADRPSGDDQWDSDADAEAVGRKILLDQLAGAPRSRAQLATALKRKLVPDGVAEALLDRFTDVGLIDDAAYAETYVRSKHAERGLAGRALKAELTRKGVSAEVAAVATEGIDADQELATARALVAKRLGSVRGLAPEAQVRRLAGGLARKGYAPGLAYRVVREALATVELPDDPELDD
ncbi:MAG: regulatory protein [Frankiales bacterium]|nr:regulatory protein [Frankiales bacterium]